jgi:hypothetical protein
VCGVEEIGCGVVFAELPDHKTAELMVERELGFVANREWIVVGPEDIAVEEPGCLRIGVAVDGGG